MANFLTSGRTALLDALKADAELAARVKTWHEFGAGLKHRYRPEPADCPLLALSPTEGDVTQSANVIRDIPQLLTIDLATDGQNIEPMEELLAAVIERVHACNQNALGLADEGMTAVTIERILWKAEPDRTGARLLWVVSVLVRLLWKRQ